MTIMCPPVDDSITTKEVVLHQENSITCLIFNESSRGTRFSTVQKSFYEEGRLVKQLTMTSGENILKIHEFRYPTNLCFERCQSLVILPYPSLQQYRFVPTVPYVSRNVYRIYQNDQGEAIEFELVFENGRKIKPHFQEVKRK